jgi:hypothetical protein
MKLLRRLFVLLVFLAVLAAAGVAAVVFVAFAPVSTADEVAFQQKLAIPPLADSHVDSGRTRIFDLTAQEGTTALLPGKPTQTWGSTAPTSAPPSAQPAGPRSG